MMSQTPRAQQPPSSSTDAARSEVSGNPRSPQNIATGRLSDKSPRADQKAWPKLPGFAPPVCLCCLADADLQDHRFGTYGIIPVSTAPPSPNNAPRSSRASSVETESSDAAVPSASMGAPIQALQTLANAADQAAAFANGSGDLSASERSDVSRLSLNGANTEGDGHPQRKRKRRRDSQANAGIHLRVRKQTKPDPTPRNPFPDVVTKGLVSETEARELWDMYAEVVGSR